MNTLYETYNYRVTKLFCSMVGLWPHQPQHRKRAIQSFNIFILFSYLPPQLKKLYDVWGKDVDAICMCMPPLLTIIACLVKITTINTFDSEINMLLRQIEKNWEIASKREEYKILLYYTSKAGKLCCGYSFILCNGLICFILMPTISPLLDIIFPLNVSREKTLGFDLDYGIDMQTYWFWLWLHTSIAGTVVIFIMIAADIMYCTFTIHSCWLFALARYKLEHVSDSIRKYTTETFDNHYYDAGSKGQYTDERRQLEDQVAAVREGIISHKKAIECAQLLHCIYAWYLFTATSLTIIIVSISAVQLVSKLSKWTEMAMSGAYVIGELTHFFFLSLTAQYITDQSLNIHKSAYSCVWYSMPTKIQKSIILILMRSSTSCKLTAGKFCAMSLENFCTVIQTSMSYFTVLASFR